MLGYTRASLRDETVSVKIISYFMAGKLKLIFRDFLRSLHQLWHEVIGTLFLLLAVAFGVSAVNEYRKYSDSSGTTPWSLASALALSVLTFAFGIHSFWKARKMR